MVDLLQAARYIYDSGGACWCRGIATSASRLESMVAIVKQHRFNDAVPVLSSSSAKRWNILTAITGCSLRPSSHQIAGA
ncbi:hypothetical protein OH492_13975 [Vibrio chagasii]|nr:hypothetical protein [Vibrio chagasii]